MADSNPYRADADVQRETAIGDEQSKPEGKGCFFYGCLFSLIGFVLFLVLLIGGGYYLLKGQINQYTDESPMKMPSVDLSEEELTAISDRFEKFTEQVVEGTEEELPETVTLVLTADDINGFISQHPDFAGKVFIEIEEGQVLGKISIPTDMLPIGKGRYFNATAKFNVSLANGVLIVRLASATVKGTPLPQPFVDGFATENLASELYNNPKAAATIGQVESLDISDGKITLIARPKIISKEEQADGEALETDTNIETETNTDADTSTEEPALTESALSEAA